MKKQVICVIALVLFANLTAVSIQAAEKHPFGTEDMAALRSARPIAVSPDGETILYEVSFGGSKGRTNREWRLIAADGSNERKLTLPEHFAPLGFMKDGASLYGTLEVEKKSQLAIVPLEADKPTVLSRPAMFSRLIMTSAGRRRTLNPFSNFRLSCSRTK